MAAVCGCYCKGLELSKAIYWVGLSLQGCQVTSLCAHAIRQKKLSIYLLEMIFLPAVDGKHGWWLVVTKMPSFELSRLFVIDSNQFFSTAPDGVRRADLSLFVNHVISL